MGRQCESKTLCKQRHIQNILLGGSISICMAEHLHFRSETPHPPTGNEPWTGKSLCRIDPILPVFHKVDTIASLAKNNRMNIHFQTNTIADHE